MKPGAQAIAVLLDRLNHRPFRKREGSRASVFAELDKAGAQPRPSGWPSGLIDWARKIGPHTARLVERMLADTPHPEMGYRASLGIMRLAKTCSHERMEAARERALLMGPCL